MTGSYNRRRWLRALGTVGVGLTAVPLAGCSGGSDSGGGGDGDGGDGGGDGSGGGGDGSMGTDTVEMTDELTFVPDRIEVSSGTTVTWENVGTIGHTVTAYEDEIPEGAEYFASGGFDSEQAARDGYPDKGNVTEGETYEHTFETTGTYEYFCVPHELNGMVGSVEVI